MNWSKFLLIALLFSFTAKGQSNEECPTIPVLQQLALVQLYAATDGSNWTNPWDFSQPICDWYGVSVNNGVVTGLSLNNNNLVGTLPEGLCNLTSLNGLSLFQNSLEGSIPDCIGDLVQLTTLNLSDNNLTGSIPSSLGNLTNLINLSLNSNNLDNTIPSSISNLTSLLTLNFSDNNLSGSLPEGLGNLQNLMLLYLGNNNLTGAIPDSIGSLSRLLILNLNTNQLSDTIPESFAGLTSLVILDLANNELVGPIPAALTILPYLRNLHLSNNQLSGSIPVFSQIYNLEVLCLDGNLLSGSIPTELSNILSLKKLKLGNNELTGELPEALSQLNLLEEYTANNNLLSGCFPISYDKFCDITTDFNQNAGLPTNGDFDSFCSTNIPCPPKEDIDFEVEGADADCYSGNRISVNITLGTPRFTVKLTQVGVRFLGQFNISNTRFSIRGISPGTYDITIIDANSYQKTVQLVISSASDCQIVEEEAEEEETTAAEEEEEETTAAEEEEAEEEEEVEEDDGQIVGDEVASSRSNTTSTTLTLADLETYDNRVEVFANYPNPFTQSTTLPFTLSETQTLNLSVINATGKRVYQLQQSFDAGDHQVQLKENIFTQSGLYIYHVQYGDKLISGKLMKL